MRRQSFTLTGIGLAAVLGLSGCAGAPTSDTAPTTGAATTAASDGSIGPDSGAQPADSATAPHGTTAELASFGSFQSVEAETGKGFRVEGGWWELPLGTGTFLELQEAHPDTLIVAGWLNVVAKGYQRQDDGTVHKVDPATFGAVPIDPTWPEEWILLDAHTHELIDVLTGPSQSGPPDLAIPEGYVALSPQEAPGFYALADGLDNADVVVTTNGQVVGMIAAASDGQDGFMVRFDNVEPTTWFKHREEAAIDLPGFSAHGILEPVGDFTLSALSDDEVCGFTSSSFVYSGDLPAALADVIAQLPSKLAALCDWELPQG